VCMKKRAVIEHTLAEGATAARISVYSVKEATTHSFEDF